MPSYGHSAIPGLELWGGVECTVNRVQDRYHCQLTRNGHAYRDDDLEQFATLGIRALRYPILWERTAPHGLDAADWCWPDARLAQLRDLGITPIAGLVHHGSGPRHTSLIDPGFADGLAQYAGAVAARYPWIDHYTPVNEPLTTARFSGLYGVWYPHGNDVHTFMRALVNQCRAVVLAMQAIRRVNPQAKLVQTDDLGKVHSTPLLAYQADFENERRWLSWDLLCGRVDRAHPIWSWLTYVGIPASDLEWFERHPCPPDIIGVNYYITSERLLDERYQNYPARCDGGNGRHRYADIEAARALQQPTIGVGPLLTEAWERYGIPLAITEAHIDASREDQMRWLRDIWHAAEDAQRKGADVRAVTVWALLGSFDWNCLVTECRDYYEPGPFDIRGDTLRPTALAGLMRDLAVGKTPSHPALAGPGWWCRPDRFLCPPVSLGVPVRDVQCHSAARNAPNDAQGNASLARSHPSRGEGRGQSGMVAPSPPWQASDDAKPILIIGATGTLGQAFARLCRARGLAHRVLARCDMDIMDRSAVERALERYAPWAVVNAAGYVRVDDAERERARCYCENALGPALLAAACARHGLPLLTFSSDLVFDGSRDAPYVESDPVQPLSIYGRSKADAERYVLDKHPAALVVRTSAFFGPWDTYNFITLALRALAAQQRFVAANDLTVSPTYVPDLVHACLDLLIDGESGLWHLTNGEPITWHQLAARAAAIAGIAASSLEPVPAMHMNYLAKRPRYSALATERARLLPSLAQALGRYLEQSGNVARAAAGATPVPM